MPPQGRPREASALAYGDLAFGFASAESEAARAPELLRDGFMDRWHTDSASVPGGDFLILGYKGSGKSAIAEHLRLRAESNPLEFVKSTYLASDFQFGLVGDLAEGVGDRPGAYVAVWLWLLLLQVLDSISHDEQAMIQSELARTVSALRQIGLLPTSSLRATALASRKKSVTVNLPQVLKLSLEEVQQVRRGSVALLVDELMAAVTAAQTTSRHVITVDGLDEIYLRSPPEYDIVSALMMAADRLNAEMLRTATPVKVLVLCRTDVFERLPGANKNKIRQDSALELDWYQNTRHPERTALVQLANLKVSATHEGIDDLFSRFFPERLQVGSQQFSTLRYLIEHTRHTPRDFLQLLKALLDFAPPNGALSPSDMLSGLRKYCVDYFVPEIKDELIGPLTSEQVDAVFGLLGSLPRRKFDFAAVDAEASRNVRYQELDWPRALGLLFEASAIGNQQTRYGGTAYYTFKYRNPHSRLSFSRRMILHRAVAKALNLLDN